MGGEKAKLFFHHALYGSVSHFHRLPLFLLLSFHQREETLVERKGGKQLTQGGHGTRATGGGPGGLCIYIGVFDFTITG